MNELPKTLIQQAAAGDTQAFRRIVDHHGPALYRLAYRLVQDTGAAEDVVQESLLKAYRKLASFKFDASLGSWLHRITVNSSMDYLRRRHPVTAVENPEELAEALELPAQNTPCVAEREEIVQRTQRLLGELSPLERSALSLRHFEGYSIREIASTLKLGENACKQAIFRAVKKLRLALEPWS